MKNLFFLSILFAACYGCGDAASSHRGYMVSQSETEEAPAVQADLPNFHDEEPK